MLRKTHKHPLPKLNMKSLSFTKCTELMQAIWKNSQSRRITLRNKNIAKSSRRNLQWASKIGTGRSAKENIL